jgi:hypothetical protein
MRLNLIVFLCFPLLLVIGPMSHANTIQPEDVEIRYAIGRIQNNVAYVDIVEWDTFREAPGIIGDKAQAVMDRMESPFREPVKLSQAIEYLPEWATENLAIVGFDGRATVRARAAYVEVNMCGENCSLGIEIELPGELVFQDESEGDLSNGSSGAGADFQHWAVAVAPADVFTEPYPGYPGMSAGYPTDAQTAFVDAQLASYGQRFIDEFLDGEIPDDGSLEADYQMVLGRFKGCGEGDEPGGRGEAVFYNFRSGEIAMGVVEIINADGVVKLEVNPWDSPISGIYVNYDPMGAMDLDGDLWDELVVNERGYEGGYWSAWDPEPDGTIELARSMYRGC